MVPGQRAGQQTPDQGPAISQPFKGLERGRYSLPSLLNVVLIYFVISLCLTADTVIEGKHLSVVI